MQDDLSDAVKWAVETGLADPNRVVIAGASYGGYAAMAGLTFTPELYAAGVNYVGVTDLKLIASQRRSRDDRKFWTKTRLGDFYEDADELYARSPVNFAQQIQAPVIMAYGQTDPRVTREHGDDMRAAMSKHGKEFEFLIESGEGHGFRKEENAIAFYTRVDEFLKRYVLAKVDVKIGPTEVLQLPAKSDE
jgi:dipeptidyl aminopeptidase/acylaminoacyl peptidase